MVGESVKTLVTHDILGRLMIQCARHPGLAQVFEDLLGFEGNEFYRSQWPEMVGKTFAEVLVSFPEAIPCGVKHDGKMALNPPAGYIIEPEDEILFIAEDNDSYAPGQQYAIPGEDLENLLAPISSFAPKDTLRTPEFVLFVGWRRDINDMVSVIDDFLSPGSELWMFNDLSETERTKRLKDGGLDPETHLVNIRLVHRWHPVPPALCPCGDACEFLGCINGSVADKL
ncbi:hypothetical protein CYMTET_34510, partial [Cymbomonas tetramitiformis]